MYVVTEFHFSNVKNLRPSLELTDANLNFRHAATSTDIRKRKIEDGIARANYNNHPCVKEFGFSVGNEFQKLDARVLLPPKIQYSKRIVPVMRGVWRSDQFVAPVTIKNWTMVGFVPRYGPRPDDFKRMAQFVSRFYANKNTNVIVSIVSVSTVSQRRRYDFCGPSQRTI